MNVYVLLKGMDYQGDFDPVEIVSLIGVFSSLEKAQEAVDESVVWRQRPLNKYPGSKLLLGGAYSARYEPPLPTTDTLSL